MKVFTIPWVLSLVTIGGHKRFFWNKCITLYGRFFVVTMCDTAAFGNNPVITARTIALVSLLGCPGCYCMTPHLLPPLLCFYLVSR